ncbi:hypothetical protein DAPPUDRAFT_255532 [Daphnia pulex]|uniref:G-protein coupled receptors family 1 profile domain-containing protein n=1 Tax=Daphnia pulex TaxID=6669 RepID=E9H9F1_DAPPU|nr:hypothetical protein DAPPUDRAFT_255532 [Daphnia pulex]|eukprot:EFX71665.1 hypothetical protein DAPPUDRAFT_255532 [Daphnia pulex]
MNNTSSTIVNQGNVIFTQNGQVYNPIDLDLFLVVTKCVCCSIGIPLNLLIAVTIVRLRRLRSKPRNIFLLGIILSYLLFFLYPIIELTYWGLYPVEPLCRAFIAILALPQILLLLNMLLALADRYVVINHSLFHREKVTVRLASGIVIFSSIFFVFLAKFVYIAGLVPLRCEMYVIHSKIIFCIIIGLLLMCIVLNIVVYRQTKVLFGESRKLTNPTNEMSRISTRNHGRMGDNNDEMDGQDLAIVDGDNVLIESSQLGTSGNESANVRPSVSSPSAVRAMSIHVDRGKLSQMEMEATRSLIIGVTSLVLTVFPPVIFFLTFFVCRLIAVDRFDCNNLTLVIPYMRELGLIHAVYTPLIILLRNKELRLSISIHVY